MTSEAAVAGAEGTTIDGHTISVIHKSSADLGSVGQISALKSSPGVNNGGKDKSLNSIVSIDYMCMPIKVI